MSYAYIYFLLWFCLAFVCGVFSPNFSLNLLLLGCSITCCFLLLLLSVPSGQRPGLLEARHAGKELQVQRGKNNRNRVDAPRPTVQRFAVVSSDKLTRACARAHTLMIPGLDSCWRLKGRRCVASQSWICHLRDKHLSVGSEARWWPRRCPPARQQHILITLTAMQNSCCVQIEIGHATQEQC